MRVCIDNDANLMCLAEFKAGGARGARNVICLTLGTGVGGGIIIEGKLYRGSSFAAGEIGHMPINERGPACNCGGRACLEAYIGNHRIEEMVFKYFKKEMPLDQVSRMARNGDQKACAIWKDVGRKLGIALVGAVNLLNPDRIVIGGGVANAGSVLFDAVKETILLQAMDVQARHVTVSKARLGNDAGMIGAAFLVREEVLLAARQ
jgi:glucokinase